MFYPVWDNLLVLAEFFCATNYPINPCLKYVLFSSRPFGVLDKFLMSFTGCSSSIKEALMSEEMMGMKVYQKKRKIKSSLKMQLCGKNFHVNMYFVFLVRFLEILYRIFKKSSN